MATIDTYKHELLDFFDCPSDYDIIYGNSIKKIAIYQLNQNIPDCEENFDGNQGDIIVGGGSGEVESLRISQKAILFFKTDSYDDFNSREELVKHFWSTSFIYKLGGALIKIGWNPKDNMEFWFAKKIIDQLFEKGKITLPNTA